MNCSSRQVHVHSCWLYRFQLWVTTKVRSQQSMQHACVVSLPIAFSRVDMNNKSVCSLKPPWRYCLTCFLIVPIAGCFINNSQTFALKYLSPQINQCASYQMKEVSSPQNRLVCFLDQMKAVCFVFCLGHQEDQGHQGFFCELSNPSESDEISRLTQYLYYNSRRFLYPMKHNPGPLGLRIPAFDLFTFLFQPFCTY